jgi:vacuolar-type H+-ATPase subunit E/Vma4
MSTIIGSGLESYLHRQARERALNIIDDARDQAREIVSHVEEEVALMRRELLTDARRTVDDRRRQSIAQARLQANQILVRHEEEIIRQVWKQVVDALRGEWDAVDRRQSLRCLVVDAAAQLGGGPLELFAGEDDRATLEEMLPALRRELAESHGVTRLDLADQTASIWGGVRVRRTDTQELVDNSLGERLALAQRMLRDEVYRRLSAAEHATDPRAKEI